jgi:hypothetical protein
MPPERAASVNMMRLGGIILLRRIISRCVLPPPISVFFPRTVLLWVAAQERFAIMAQEEKGQAL